MSVHLVFEKRTDSQLKRLVKLLTGPYVHTEIILTTTHTEAPHIQRKAYSAYIDYVFSCTPEKCFGFADDTHDFIKVAATADEIERIKTTCESHAQLETPYNLKDMLLSIVPGRWPTEKTIYEVKSLFCSQAMVLILRSCLEPEHPVIEALKSVNSRTVSPSHLFAVLDPVCERTFSKQVVKQRS